MCEVTSPPSLPPLPSCALAHLAAVATGLLNTSCRPSTSYMVP